VIEEKSRTLSSRLDEATLRLWAAVEARALGHGGVSAVARASGLSRTTIYAGLRELEAPTPRHGGRAGGSGRIRARGGGRKKLTVKDPTLLGDLDAVVEPGKREWSCCPSRRTHSTNQEEVFSQPLLYVCPTVSECRGSECRRPGLALCLGDACTGHFIGQLAW
jgi:hypothetical protein